MQRQAARPERARRAPPTGRRAEARRPAGGGSIASRYFRDTAGLGFYNIGADRVRAMARAIVKRQSGRLDG